MLPKNILKLLAPISITLLSFVINDGLNAQYRDSYLRKAQKAFNKRNYDASIIQLKKHLRRNKRDSQGWQLLGASYYHTGLPKKALKILKTQQLRVRDRSFNLLYQALSYDVLKKKGLFVKNLKKSIQARGRYSPTAMYELGVHFYRKRKARKALSWLNEYLKLERNGKYSAAARKLIRSIQIDRPIKNPPRMKRPKTENALYRYNPLSLSDSPHFWLSRIGFSNLQEQGKELSNLLRLKTRTETEMAIYLDNAIGFGPYREKENSILGGYAYKQQWKTNQERIETWTEDISDFNYIPFRADLLERQHQLFIDYRAKLSHSMFVGVHGRHERSFVGSNIIPGPDDTDIKANVSLSTINLAIPWAGISITKNFRALGFWFLRHEKNHDDDLFSNKTYQFSTDSEIPLSGGFQLDLDLPKFQTDLKFEYNIYTYIYNDYFEDYDRQSLRFELKHQVFPGFFVEGAVGTYLDTYQQRLIRTKQCELPNDTRVSQRAVDTQKESFQGLPPTRCDRVDQGQYVEVQGYYDWSQFRRLAASFTYVTNINDIVFEDEFQRTAFTVSISLAFPSVRRAIKYSENFGDNKFIKKGAYR